MKTNTEDMTNLERMLIDKGFKMWDEKTLHFNGSDKSLTRKFQKRIDSLFPETTLCDTNDKLFLNVDVNFLTTHKQLSKSIEISMTHEKNDMWFDCRIYSVSFEKFVSIPLNEWEEKMIQLWNKYVEIFKVNKQ